MGLQRVGIGERSIVEHEVRSADARDRQSPTLERLDDQIGWYDRKSQTAQRRYKILKLAQVIIAALIPLASALSIPGAQFKWVPAILGLLVLVIEAIQQLNQDQQNWIAYRSTCEALKHEKYLYLAAADPMGAPARSRGYPPLRPACRSVSLPEAGQEMAWHRDPARNRKIAIII